MQQDYHPSSRIKTVFIGCFALYLLFGMHYFQHNLGGYGLSLPFNITGWIFIGLMIGLSLWQITINRAISYSTLWLKIVFCSLLLLIPLLYPNNNQAEHSYDRLLGLWAGALWLGGLYQFNLSKQQRYQLLYWVLIGVLIEAIFGLVQYYCLSEANSIGYNTIHNRPYGIFQQPNVAADFLLSGVIIGLYLLISDQNKTRLKYCILGLVTVLSPLIIVLNQSRTGYLTGVLALLFILPWGWQKNHRGTFKLWISGVLAGLIIAFISMHTISSQQGRSESSWSKTSGRVTLYSISIEMIKEKPLLGWGYGNFARSYLEQKTKGRAAGHTYNEEINAEHPHNEVLFWGVEGGLLPIVIFIYLAGIFIALVYKTPWRTRLMYLALLTPILGHCMTEYPFYHAAVIWIIFLLLIYQIDRDINQAQATQFHYTFALRCFAIIIPAITGVFMITSLQTLHLLTKFERTEQNTPELLDGIVNPVAFQNRLEFYVMNYQLRVGISTKRKDLLEGYVAWSPTLWVHSPRPELYYNQIIALEALDAPLYAKQVMKEASYLYPKDKRFFIEVKTANEQLPFNNKSNSSLSFENIMGYKNRDATSQE